LKYQKKRLLAGTGNGILEILELQPENKKKMDALSFINGYRLQEGECFV
jgi:methionyl-tRNA formyltransferase